MKYNIAILSKGRPLSISLKTLTTLREHNIPSAFIDIFVIEAEYELYLKMIPKDLYNVLHCGRNGKIEQTEFAQSVYDIGDLIVFIDDDIEAIDISLSGCETLDAFIKTAFLDCERYNSFIWGVYPIWNKWYRQKMIDDNLVKCSTDLRFLIGAFYGIKNRGNIDDLELSITRRTNSLKDDFERTIRYFLKDSIVLRYNLVATKQKFYSGGGFGIRADRDFYEMLAVQYLFEEFGSDICSVFMRNDGRSELKLRKQFVKNL